MNTRDYPTLHSDTNQSKDQYTALRTRDDEWLFVVWIIEWTDIDTTGLLPQ